MTTEDSHITFTPNTILDKRYSVIEKIGEGGMGEVYLAFDKRISRQVAIKCLKTTILSTESDKKRFLQESKLCAQINHKNVVKVIDAFFHNECPCFAMEYIEGCSLRAYFKNEQLPEVTIPVIIDALDAINGAHEVNIIHRDLKPSNIFITSDNIVKVGDWGIAKATNDPTGMTQTGMILGTPEYISPERISKGSSLPQGDIYSMGCILYEALCGRPPFVGNLGQIISNHLKKNPETPPGIHKDLRKLIFRLLEKDEKLRPSNALKVRNELEAIYEKIMTGGSFFAKGGKKKHKNVLLSDTTQKNFPAAIAQTERKPETKNKNSRENTKIIASILFILILCSAIIIPRFFKKMNVKNSLYTLNLEMLIKKASTDDFERIEIRYDSTLKGSYPFKIIEQAEHKTLASGFIKFSDELTPNGRTSNSLITLDKPCYKRLSIEIGSDPVVTFPVDMMKAWLENFKLLSSMSREARISLYKSLEYLGGTKSPSKKEILRVLKLNKLTPALLDKFEVTIPRYLDYLHYSENIYLPESEVLEPLRGISSFLGQHSIHPVFGLSSKLMGFQFSSKRKLRNPEGWTTLSQRSLLIDRNDGNNHFPVLVYKLDAMANVDALLAHSETTAKFLNIAFKGKERRHKDDFSDKFKLEMTTINLAASIQWPPKKAFLDVVFQCYGGNNYFSVSVNGNKRVKVFFSWDFHLYLGQKTIASIPISPSWLNKGTNVIEFFSERLTENIKKDLLQTALTKARIRGRFTK